MEAWRPEDLSVTLLASEDRTEVLTAKKDSKETSEVNIDLTKTPQAAYRVHTALQSH